MVFSSVPLYLDPPNWQQHPNQQQFQGHHNNNNNHHEQNQHQFISQQSQQQPQPPQQIDIGPAAQQIRANSMSERARQAKIPPPEIPLKCPRCDSSNTKFCYYNNYSLSQPRHFCKTCRRYWTRGGALRNVPVGGGCRRNKRSTSATKSSPSSGGGATPSKSVTVSGEQLTVNSIPGIGNNSMSFMASLQNIAQLGNMSNMGLTNFSCGPMITPNSLGVGVGGTDTTGIYNNRNNNNNLEFLHQVQFPNFLGGFEIPGSSGGAGGLYSSSFQNVGHNNNIDDSNISKNSSSTVKTEENGQQGINIAKQLLMGISTSNVNDNGNGNGNGNNNTNQYWGGNLSTSDNVGRVNSMWTDLSGLNSSSTTHLL